MMRASATSKIRHLGRKGDSSADDPPARELWPEVGDSLRKGWRIVVVMTPPHLQERSDTPCWTIQLLPCVSQGMLKIR